MEMSRWGAFTFSVAILILQWQTSPVPGRRGTRLVPRTPGVSNIVRKIDLQNFQVATSETARDINRRILLNLIRKHQPVSRADLARISGLQRSTVSSITEQLINERWVTRGAIGDLPRGRKPVFLHLNSNRTGIVGVEVRPGTTTLVLARLDASFFAQASMPTEPSAGGFVSRLCRRVQELIAAHPEVTFEGIGISVPGRVDSVSQKLVFAPNLPWRDLDLQQPLERATGLPVQVENAASACAMAEIWYGRHADVRDLVAVTVSEGIGVGMVFNGQLVRGFDGMAGEFGHVTLVENGLPCNCGNRGCWERYASVAATMERYRESLGAKSAANRETELSFEELIALAKNNDARANRELKRMASYLGAGLAMLTSGCSPEVIVVIGPVAQAWDRMEPVISDTLKRRCPQFRIPRIVPTDPATQPRLRGAIALILQKHFSAPPVA